MTLPEASLCFSKKVPSELDHYRSLSFVSNLEADKSALHTQEGDCAGFSDVCCTLPFSLAEEDIT